MITLSKTTLPEIALTAKERAEAANARVEMLRVKWLAANDAVQVAHAAELKRWKAVGGIWEGDREWERLNGELKAAIAAAERAFGELTDARALALPLAMHALAVAHLAHPIGQASPMVGFLVYPVKVNWV